MGLTDGLACYLKCDEISGMRMDATGNGNDHIESWPVPATTGLIGDAAAFRDLMNQSLWRTGAVVVNPFSASLWVKPYIIPGDKPVYFWCQPLNNQPRQFIRWEHGRAVEASAGVGIVTHHFLDADAAWHHFALTFAGNTFTLYVDGQLSGTRTDAVFSASNRSVIGNLSPTIGRRSCNADLDEIGLWARELSAAEVSQLYNGGSGLTYEEF